MSEDNNSQVAESPNGDSAKIETKSVEAAAPEAELQNNYEPVPITIQSMLKAGTHFGHKTDRWNPKMLPFIFTQKSNVHIINLDLTLQHWLKARKFISDIASRGGNVLFVGTKHQARKPVEAAAKRSGSYYVNNRWLGGMLSNFETIKKSLRRMKKMQELLEQADNADSDVKLAKKEKLDIRKELVKLEANLGGIKEMRKHPDVIFVVDVNKESIAVAEARKLHIPVVALVDTNVDPKYINFPIPANDDAARTVELFVDNVADAILEGRAAYKERLQVNQTPGSEVKVETRKEKNKEEVAVEPVANGVSA